jgi:PST family polysaccharide transporter
VKLSEQLSTRTLNALGWSYLGFGVRAGASFVTGVVLARILGPKPFGQIAAALLVFGLGNVLADGGFGSAIVQAPELDDADIRFAFTCQVLIGIVLTVICALSSHAVAVFLHDPAIERVIQAISCVFLIQAVGQTSTSLLKRRLLYRESQTAQVAGSVIGYSLIGITAACLGAGVWSLVTAQITYCIVYSAIVVLLARHSWVPYWGQPRWHLARYGVKITGANILNYGITNLDKMFVGHAFGSIALGLYSRAFNTVSPPTEAVVGTWQSVLFASSSRARGRIEVLQQGYLASVTVMSLVMCPVFWSVGMCASSVVAGLYGGRWNEAAPLLRPLALAMTFHALMALSGPMLSAANQVKRELYNQGLTLLVAIVVFAASIRFSAVWLSWGVFVVYAFRSWALSRQALLLLQLKWSSLLRASEGGILLGGATAIAVWTTDRIVTSHLWNPVATLVVLFLTGSTTSLILLVIASDRLLSRNLVQVLNQISGALPGAIARPLKKIDRKQAERELLSGHVRS